MLWSLHLILNELIWVFNVYLLLYIRKNNVGILLWATEFIGYQL